MTAKLLLTTSSSSPFLVTAALVHIVKVQWSMLPLTDYYVYNAIIMSSSQLACEDGYKVGNFHIHTFPRERGEN